MGRPLPFSQKFVGALLIAILAAVVGVVVTQWLNTEKRHTANTAFSNNKQPSGGENQRKRAKEPEPPRAPGEKPRDVRTDTAHDTRVIPPILETTTGICVAVGVDGAENVDEERPLLLAKAFWELGICAESRPIAYVELLVDMDDRLYGEKASSGSLSKFSHLVLVSPDKELTAKCYRLPDMQSIDIVRTPQPSPQRQLTFEDFRPIASAVARLISR